MQAVVTERIDTENWRSASRVPAQAKMLVVGQYKLIQEIGHGAMGVAWLALDTYADRKVCLKLLPQEREIRDTDVEQMKTTFRLTHRLQHQHLCPHIQFAIDPQIGPFLVMKYYNGCSLTKLCVPETGHRRIFSLADALRVLSPVADGLDYLHAQGLVHRDIKPGNIVMGRRHRDVQIVDFGMVEKYGALVATDRHIEGTLVYLAPEIWGGGAASPESDQYALATVAYELLAGHRPFDQCSSATALMHSVKTAVVPKISQLSDNINAVLQRGLAKDPIDRFPSCRALVKALRAAHFQGQESGGLRVVNLEDTILFSDGDTPRSELMVRPTAQVG